MFINFNATTAGLVATIAGKLNQPPGIGTVKWTWKDDGGAVHTEQLENALYFPNSPIDIKVLPNWPSNLTTNKSQE